MATAAATHVLVHKLTLLISSLLCDFVVVIVSYCWNCCSYLTCSNLFELLGLFEWLWDFSKYGKTLNKTNMKLSNLLWFESLDDFDPSDFGKVCFYKSNISCFYVFVERKENKKKKKNKCKNQDSNPWPPAPDDQNTQHNHHLPLGLISVISPFVFYLTLIFPL